MTTICCICDDNNINDNNKCNTCRQCVCDCCYGKIIKKSLYRSFNYNCPFCKTVKTDYIIKLEKEQIISLFTNNEINMIEKIDELQNEMELLVDEIMYNRKIEKKLLKELTYLNEKNEKQEKQIKELKEIKKQEKKEKIKVKKMNISYKDFFKEIFKAIKDDNPEMLSKDIVKQIGVLWQEEKKRYELKA